MKITLAGSLGHIGKPLTKELVEKGHTVTVISSNAERNQEIEALGAKAAIGSMRDVNFLTEAYTGADIGYVMETMGEARFTAQDVDVVETIAQIGRNYKQAIQASGLKRVVHLSSIGGHTDKGNGILAFHHKVEQILGELPADVSIKVMRPVGFYYNMLAFIPTIKAQNAIFSNYGGDEKEPWVAPVDIATVIAEEMEKPFSGRTIRYIASDEVSPNEVASILGNAIGKPDLKWVQISDEQLLNGMVAAGMNPAVARGFVEMNAGRRSGVIGEDYKRHKPVLSKTKLREFAKGEFAAVYKKA